MLELWGVLGILSQVLGFACHDYQVSARWVIARFKLTKDDWILFCDVQNASEFCAAAACNTSLKNLGMAQEQLSGVSIASLPSLKLSRLCTSTNTSGANGLGYFKLVPSTSSAANNGVNDMSNGFTGRSSGAAECVVVAFGSAPGEPNWAGLLGRIAKSSETPKEQYAPNSSV